MNIKKEILITSEVANGKITAEIAKLTSRHCQTTKKFVKVPR